jgi:hypothetical protein
VGFEVITAVTKERTVFLGCDSVLSGINIPTFQINLLLLSLGYVNDSSTLMTEYQLAWRDVTK